MLRELAEVWRFRELLLNFVVRDIKVRYKNSILGFVWSLIIPISQVAILTVVFKYIWGVEADNYAAYLLCGILPYNFFQRSILDGTSSVNNHSGLIKKTYFPREIIPTSIVLSNLVHFALAMLTFFMYFLALRAFSYFVHGTSDPPVLITWLLLPVVMLINSMLCLGISFILSCLNTYYEDIKYITQVILNLAFYAMPILYFAEMPLQLAAGHSKLGTLVHMHFYWNPLSYLLITYRKILLPPYNAAARGMEIHDIPLDYWYLGLTALTSVVILVVGYTIFNKLKWHFAERL